MPIGKRVIDTTILTYTDNSLDTKFTTLCRDYLLWSAGDMPIVSVSQKPIQLGTNICVGEIGRSVDSMFIQILTAASAAETEYVALAEHDVLYPRGYFEYVPPKNDVFYYNINYVVLHLNGDLAGLFAGCNKRRVIMSQLFCNRQLLVDKLTPLIDKLDNGQKINQKKGLVCEPGRWQDLFDPRDDIVEDSTCELICSDWPSVDIRHGGNLTRGTRGYVSIFPQSIYWGTMGDIISRKPMKELCLELDI